MRLLLRQLAALAVGLGLLAPAPASAQSDRFPCGDVSSTSPNRAQIEAFADAQIARLADPAQRGAAGQSLVSPFVECPGSDVSVQFRIAYGGVLGARTRLPAVVDDGDPQAAAIAAYVAGQCATAETNEVLKAALQHESPAVRTAAAVGARRTLQHFKGGRAAFQAAQASDLVAALGAAVASETDPIVAQRELAALAVAANAPDHPELAAPASQVLSLALARWIKAQRPLLGQRALGAPDEALTVAAGVEALNQAFLQPNVVRAMNEAAWKDAAAALAQVIAYARDRLIAEDEMTPATRQAMTDALNRTATLIYTIETATRGRGAARQAPAFGDVFTKDVAGDQPGAFAAAAETWIGQAGNFTAAPYSLPSRDLDPMAEPPSDADDDQPEPADAPDAG